MEYFKPLPGHPSQNASPPTQPRSAFSRGLYYTDIPCNAGNHNPPSCVNPLPTDYPCSTVRVRIQVHGPLENRDFYPYNTGIACSPLVRPPVGLFYRKRPPQHARHIERGSEGERDIVPSTQDLRPRICSLRQVRVSG